MSSFDHTPIETIRINDRENRRIVDEIRARRSESKGPARGIRVNYANTSVTVTITNPGGNTANYTVIAKNLSRRGIGFFHGRFIYPDSPCKVVIPTLDDESITMEGKIARCQHVTGTIHEVGVIFDSPLDLTLFTQMTAKEIDTHLEEHSDDVASGEINSQPTEKGKLLLVDPSKLDRALCVTFLGQVGLCGYESADAEEARQVTGFMEVDAAIIDVSREPEYGFDLIKEMRQAGFNGPILAISIEDDEQTQSLAIESGASEFLPKPIDSDSLHQVLDSLMGLGISDGSVEDPIYSTFGDDKAMRPLLREFVNNIKDTPGELKKSLQASDQDRIRIICRQLKGAGGGYGYDEVTSGAQEVLESLEDAQSDVEGLRATVDELIGILHRVSIE